MAPKVAPSPCVEANLVLIWGLVGKKLVLTVEDFATVNGTTAGAVHQKIKRGTLGVDNLNQEGRVLFAVLAVAEWLCGAVQSNAVQVSVSKKMPHAVRSGADLRSRMEALRASVHKKAEALRALENTDKAEAFHDARKANAQAWDLVAVAVERAHLRAMVGDVLPPSVIVD
jgi:hypothetical protein